MMGLIVLAISVLLLLAYLWFARTVVRYIKRKTGSNLIAAFAAIGILLVTFGDTLFNRWYHKAVLCKRADVGIHIIEKVLLPKEYLDKDKLRPNFPLPLEQPFFSRFSLKETRTNSGYFPLTAHGRVERSVVDSNSGKVIAKFVDYWPSGGPWWGTPLEWLDESSFIGWFYGRQHVPTCFNDGTQNALLAVSGYFYLLY